MKYLGRAQALPILSGQLRARSRALASESAQKPPTRIVFQASLPAPRSAIAQAPTAQASPLGVPDCHATTLMHTMPKREAKLGDDEAATQSTRRSGAPNEWINFVSVLQGMERFLRPRFSHFELHTNPPPSGDAEGRDEKKKEYRFHGLRARTH